MPQLRFCAYQYPHLPLDSLTERWREAERLGFDVLWNCDTLVEPDRPRHMMFDGPATLTMMAELTRTIRIGTLVTSLYFRHPATFAKSATTIDHLSSGRLEVALGVGDPSAGPAAHGPWMLAIAARHADAWSSWGGYDVTTDADFFRVTTERCRRFDDLCVAADRDPATIRHSVVC